MTILILPYRLHTLLLSACFQQDNQHCCAVTGKEYIHLDILMHWYIYTPSLLIILILLTSPTQKNHPTHSWTVLSDSLAKSYFLISPFTPEAVIYWNIFQFVESFFFLQYKKWYSKYFTVAYTTQHACQLWYPNLFYFLSVYIIYKKKSWNTAHCFFKEYLKSHVISKSFI